MDYKSILKNDPRFKPVIDHFGDIQLEKPENQNIFSRLSRAIIGQQVSVKAAQSIFNKFLEIHNTSEKLIQPLNILASDVDTLRSAGLSRSKALSIMDLSEKMNENKISDLNKMSSMSEDEILDQLVQVKGIGPWTAEMFMMFTLGREDVLSTGDLGLKKGVAILYDLDELPTPDVFSDIAEKWRPYRTYACMYLWKVCHFGQKP